MKYRSIAIDGPSGAGKSTLAKQLARELGFLYVDTGAIYRTVGLFARQENAAPDDSQAVAALLPRLDIRMAYDRDGLQRMYLNGADVTDDIRRNEISYYASRVSAIPEVRAFLLDMQRRLAREHDVIMDGRDIGTVVLRGEQVDEAQILRDVVERDERDVHRAVSPLKKAEDAVVVDTTGNSQEESFGQLLSVIRDNLNRAEGAHE